MYTHTNILNSTRAEGQIHVLRFKSFCSSSNLHTSVYLEKDCLRGKRQTAAPRDAWRHRLAAGAANLGPVTGPTLRKKPPAVWHRWDAIELAHSFGSPIHVDLILLLFFLNRSRMNREFIHKKKNHHIKLKRYSSFVLPAVRTMACWDCTALVLLGAKCRINVLQLRTDAFEKNSVLLL